MREFLGLLMVGLVGCMAAPPCPPPGVPEKTHVMVGNWMPETPADYAIRAWRYEHGLPLMKCAEHARNSKIISLYPEDLYKRCRLKTVAACMESYDPVKGAVVLLKADVEGQAYIVQAHELLHVLIACSGIEEKGNHSDDSWRHFPMVNLPPESPWFKPRTKPEEQVSTTSK